MKRMVTLGTMATTLLLGVPRGRSTTLALTLPAAQAATPGEAELRARGQAVCALFFDGKLTELRAQLSPQMQAALSAEALAQFHASALRQYGREQKLLRETVEHKDGLALYRREIELEHGPAPFVFTVGFADATLRQVSGFRLALREPPSAPAPSTRLDYRTKTALRLPFDGAWTVAWGGRTLADNYHAAHRQQRFAYDLFVLQDGQSHRGDGKRNSDYYAYGRAIFAPGAGRVVVAHDGVAENVPGAMNERDVAGNFVVIDHGNGEFSFLAHLVPGSLAVKVGQTVAAGQLVGRCGNSGHSSEPHLHIHLQTTAQLDDGEGLPAQFRDYIADGKRVTVGEPMRGQVIARP